MQDEDPKTVRRPWRVVAADALSETDPSRVLELIEELNNALDEDRAQRRKAVTQSQDPAAPETSARAS